MPGTGAGEGTSDEGVVFKGRSIYHTLFGTAYQQKQRRGVGNLRSSCEKKNGSIRGWISIIRSLMPLFAS